MMSNRRTLIILLVLVALTGGGRFWAKSHRATWDSGFNRHAELFKSVIEEAREVSARREAAVYGLGDSSYQTQIQEFAGRSRLGNITVRPRGNAEVGDYVLMVDIENSDHRYGRNQIFTFLYNCEVMIPRVRTTSLSIRPASEGTRKLDPGTDRDDLWKLEQVIFTKRSPEKLN
jgi:hypothetical protein